MVKNIKYRFIHRKYNGHFLAVNQEMNILECLHEDCKIISSDCRLTPFDIHCVSSNGVLKIDSNLLTYSSFDDKLTSPHLLIDSRSLLEHILDDVVVKKCIKKEI
jgi:hypothetical protein